MPTSGHSLHSYVPLRPRQHFLPNPPIGDHLNLASALTEQQENLPLIISSVGRDIADAEWAGYQHSFAGNATRAEHSAADVDFDTDLMRLARGGN